MLLALIGLMTGGLVGVAVSSARVAARALAETSPARTPKDWLSPAVPAGMSGLVNLLGREPAGSQREDAHRTSWVAGGKTQAGPDGSAPVSSRQPVDASRP